MIFRSGHNVQIVLYSYNRAMQLDAALRSFFLHCRDSDQINRIAVIFKTRGALHNRQYETLKEYYGNRYPVVFIPETDFRQNSLDVIRSQLPAEKWKYILEFFNPTAFTLQLVDDNLFVRPFSILDACRTLRRKRSVLNFSLRLGGNICYSYTKNCQITPPTFKNIGDGILEYRWPGKDDSFGYPMDISSSVYRTVDLFVLEKMIAFHSPNSLEGRLNVRVKKLAKVIPVHKISCYRTSVAFCAPINRVQDEVKNRASGITDYSADSLAQLFEEGYRIDIESFENFTAMSCHKEVEVHFTKDKDF